jgi:hypothetical protein
MIAFGFIVKLWKELMHSTTVIGGFVFFPSFVILSTFLVLMAVAEFFLVDILVFIDAALDKDDNVTRAAWRLFNQ